MKRQQFASWIALLCLAATGCASGGHDAVEATDTASAAASALAADRAHASADGSRSGPHKPRRKLPRAFRLLAAGDGAAPDCAHDLASLPAAFAASPSVWMSDIRGPKNLIFTGESALCMHGFQTDRPVTVTVSDGSRRYTTSVQPTAGKLAHTRYEPAESMFNGARLRVYDVGSGVMQSETWDFVPPSAARENIAARRSVTITAKQAADSAEYQQAVATPGEPQRAALRGDTRRRLVVSGFPTGESVAIGLYRLDPKRKNAAFARSLGSVVMPRSRTAVFTVPRSAAGAAYCVTVPLTVQYNCPSF
ncbi:hypothetical protein [Streptomyces turgidiscabies]|uniref:Lipoprotein n=1 Tax=Streptomyces turgidiscabies TaxID=85558 RepID=A0ABU0RZA8_9ACTN|nr:hypothetical protein [Streptomyces turgidiscabies]